MPSAEPELVTIAVDDATRVSGLMWRPPRPRTCLVLAHGAVAGMTHRFMAATAAGLTERDIATLRYQFPYMEHGGKRPDPPRLAHATVRAAVAAAAQFAPDLPLIAGGKSFGGRMTSQAQAAGRPSGERGRHLSDVRIPMLFLQGTRDNLALPAELEPVCGALGDRATLRMFADADHSFHVPARTGRTDPQVLGEVLDALAAWIEGVVARSAQ